MANIDQIKQLRDETGVSFTDCYKAMEEAGGNIEKAKEVLKKMGKETAQKKSERQAGQGIVASYVHANKKVGAMVKLLCETDFVARGEDFQNLAHEICLQTTAISSEETPILEQPWIKDPSKTVKDLIQEYIAKIGENIVLEKVVRYEI